VERLVPRQRGGGGRHQREQPVPGPGTGGRGAGRGRRRDLPRTLHTVQLGAARAVAVLTSDDLRKKRQLMSLTDLCNAAPVRPSTLDLIARGISEPLLAALSWEQKSFSLAGPLRPKLLPIARAKRSNWLARANSARARSKFHQDARSTLRFSRPGQSTHPARPPREAPYYLFIDLAAI